MDEQLYTLAQAAELIRPWFPMGRTVVEKKLRSLRDLGRLRTTALGMTTESWLRECLFAAAEPKQKQGQEKKKEPERTVRQDQTFAERYSNPNSRGSHGQSAGPTHR